MNMNDYQIVIFDGICNLCNGATQFIIKRDTNNIFLFAAMQSDAAKKMLNEYVANREIPDSIILIKDKKIYEKSDALIEITTHLSGLWPILKISRVIPKKLRDCLYDWLAKNRYKIFGKRETCILPTTELQKKFIK